MLQLSQGQHCGGLQCIKCAIRHDLLFKEPAPSSTIELEEDEELADAAGGDSRDAEELDAEGVCWEELLIEDEDKEIVN